MGCGNVLMTLVPSAMILGYDTTNIWITDRHLLHEYLLNVFIDVIDYLYIYYMLAIHPLSNTTG